MVKVFKAAFVVAEMLLYSFIDAYFLAFGVAKMLIFCFIDAYFFFLDAYIFLSFFLGSKLFGRFFFRNHFLVPVISLELIPFSHRKNKTTKFVEYMFECFRKCTAHIKMLCKWYIYMMYGLSSYLVGLILKLDVFLLKIFKLDVCVIVLCMLVYK